MHILKSCCFFLLLGILVQSCEVGEAYETIAPERSEEQVVYKGLSFWLPKGIPNTALELTNKAIEKQYDKFSTSVSLEQLAAVTQPIQAKYPSNYTLSSTIQQANLFLVDRTWESLTGEEQQVVLAYFDQLMTYEVNEALQYSNFSTPKGGDLFLRLNNCEIVILATNPHLIQPLLDATEEARNTAKDVYLYHTRGEQSDAFRHSVWNLLMMDRAYKAELVRLLGLSTPISMADKEALAFNLAKGTVDNFATKHETCRNKDGREDEYDFIPGKDLLYEMDLHNNKTGRLLFEARYQDPLYKNNHVLWIANRKEDLKQKSSKNQSVIVSSVADFNTTPATTLTRLHTNFYPIEIHFAGNDWAKYEIQFMLSYPKPMDTRVSKYMAGYSDGTFRPQQVLTRAEFATMIAKIIAPDLVGPAPVTFSDISGHWAEANIRTAAQAGYLSGYPDGTFRPNNPIKKMEMLVSIANGLPLLSQINTSILNNYQDAAQIPTWARQAIANATGAEIVPNYPVVNRLEPTRNARRDEAAVIFAEALRILGRQHPQSVHPDLVNPYIARF